MQLQMNYDNYDSHHDTLRFRYDNITMNEEYVTLQYVKFHVKHVMYTQLLHIQMYVRMYVRTYIIEYIR